MAIAALSLNSFSCFFEQPYDPDSQHLPPLAGGLRAALLLHLKIQGLSGSSLSTMDASWQMCSLALKVSTGVCYHGGGS